MWDRLFSEHPRSVGETYLQHMGMAGRFGARMITAGAACLVHGLLPFLFTKTGSRAINELYRRMVTHRARNVRVGFSGAKHSVDGAYDYVI